MTEVQEIQVQTSDLVFDEAFQMRADIPAVDAYQALLEATEYWPFAEPIVAFRIRGKLKVVDGFTRGRAAKAAGWKVVPVRVIDGGSSEAMRYAFGCNATHGYPRTNADKRKTVLKAISHYNNDCEITHAQIAIICRVSATYVRKLTEKLTEETQPEYQSRQECPECGVDQWIDTAAGFECGACHQILGSATRGQRLAEQAVRSQRDAPQASQPAAQTATMERPAGGLNRNKKLAEEASTSLGQIIRALETLGELEPLRPHVAEIQKVLNRRKRR